MIKKVKISKKPKLTRSAIVKLGQVLDNCEEVENVEINVKFKDNTSMSYESEYGFEFPWCDDD